MGTQQCRECEKTLPLESFNISRWGKHVSICKECIRNLRQVTRQKKREEIEQQQKAFFAEFEGKEPVEVLKLMNRAKKWLEMKGYEIILSASLTVKKNIKFDEL